MRIAIFTNDNNIKAIFHEIAFEYFIDYTFNPRTFRNGFDYIIVDNLSLTNHRKDKLSSINSKKVVFRTDIIQDFDYIFEAITKKDLIQLIFGEIFYFQKKAEEYLINRNYNDAIFCLSQILSIDSSNQEALLLIKLADLEFKQEANAMLKYYTKIKKDQGIEKACEILNNAIDILDTALNSITNNSLNLTSPLDLIDAITYKDFLKYIQKSTNQPEAIENTILSTKVAFDTKDEVFKFINQLIDYDFTEMALIYVEQISHIYPVDDRVHMLLEKIKTADTKLENKIK